MSERPPQPDDLESVDARYRRASALDASRPSERVRRAVLDHAARLVQDRGLESADAPPAREPLRRRQARATGWWAPLAGSLAVATLAALLLTPHDLPLTPRRDLASLPRRTAESAAPDTDEGATEPAASAPAATPPPAPLAPPASSVASAVSGSAGRQALSPEPPPRAFTRSAARASSTAPASARIAQPEPAAPAVPAAPSPEPAEPGPGPGPGRGRGLDEPQGAHGALEQAPRAGADAALEAQALAAAKPRAFSSVAGATGAASRTSSPALADPDAALLRAAAAGDLAALEAAIAAHADLETRDASGRTALMLAILNRRARAVDALLARGADPDAVDAEGMRPLDLATAQDEDAVAESLRRAGAH